MGQDPEPYSSDKMTGLPDFTFPCYGVFLPARQAVRRLLILSLFVFCVFPFPSVTGQEPYDTQREHMVKIQLMGRDIRDKATLVAMSVVPRHKFVPEEVREQAYADSPLPIGQGQTISQPYMVAFMTQALKLRPEHKVLEIGTGSGYQAAVLAEVADSVYTIEIVEELGLAARKLLGDMGYANVQVRIGDGYHGWPEAAPFDAIMVTAGAEFIPQPLIDQLKEGGRLIIPVGPHHGIRRLKLLRRKGDGYTTRDLMDVRFVPFTRNRD